jgi:hypothetical protein
MHHLQQHPRYPHLIRLSEKSAKVTIRRLSLVLRIKQQRVLTLPPRILITHTPNSNTHTLLVVQARTNRRLVVCGTSALDVELGHRALFDIGADELESGRNVGNGPCAAEMGLRAYAIDGDACCDPLLDGGGETFGFGVGGGVEVVVVDVEFSLGVCGAGGGEGDFDELFYLLALFSLERKLESAYWRNLHPRRERCRRLTNGSHRIRRTSR